MMPTPVKTSRAATDRFAMGMWKGKARRDQLFYLICMVVFLAISALLNATLRSKRTEWNLVRETPESEKTYRSVALHFPRLTLGGFRGIVSTYLWQQAEEDKNNHKWIDLETKYDMIGSLQPYFVSVYIYHAWNQAYNLSAQFQDDDSKYKWVLDGLSYLYKGEDYNPGVADLRFEEAQMYFQKLGSSFERIWYREHWRDDISRLHELNGKAPASDKSLALAHVRDFVDRPYFHATELGDPRLQTSPTTGWGISITDPVLFAKRTDGKQPGDPVDFRYGLSPFYFAYVEYNRCMANNKWPTTMGHQVVSALPAMSLRLWCRDDLFYTGQIMRTLFLHVSEAELLKQPDLLNRKALEVEDCYRNIQMIGPAAIDAFNLHLGRFQYTINIHKKHMLETAADVEISKAEYKLFEALLHWHLNGRKMNDTLKAEFLEAYNLYDAAYAPTMKWVDTVYPAVAGDPANNNDRADLAAYAIALHTRRDGIGKLLALQPGETPHLEFLEDTVVER